jgi:hypothetical protein
VALLKIFDVAKEFRITGIWPTICQTLSTDSKGTVKDNFFLL